MAAEGEEKLTEGDAIEAGGAVYDDEVEAPRDNVSNAMKERLMREARKVRVSIVLSCEFMCSI